MQLSVYFFGILVFLQHIDSVAVVQGDFNHYHFLGEFSRRQIDDVFLFFFFFPQIIGFDFLCKFSPYETICMKGQSLLLGKIRKNISKCHLLKLLSIKEER